MPDVILVDREDNEIGAMEKISAHKTAKLHRAISVFIFNSNGEYLLQKRAENKYHSGGLFTNSCCSHPEPGEESLATAKRRLIEEMGINADLKKAFSFIYYKPFKNGLTENELDHVFIGYVDDDLKFKPNEDEVSEYKWISFEELDEDIKKNPEIYSYWFGLIYEKVYHYLIKQN